MPTPLYGPYGQPGLLPPLSAGIDGGESLRLAGVQKDAGGAWTPRLVPGRYTLASEGRFRYLYARPQVTAVSLSSGLHSVIVEAAAAGFSVESLRAPVELRDGAGNAYTPVVQTVRFAYPVPPVNTAAASTFVDPQFLGGALSGTDSLWWAPTFGAEVLAGYRSRNPRSWDVLADQDALLYEVDTPDQIADDRSFCHDRVRGIVYGRVASQSLPPAPFSSGAVAQTYLTLSYPPDSDPGLAGGLASTDSYWTSYRSARAAFFSTYEGGTYPFYDPLRMEEVCFVDTDGLVRVRHAGGVAPKAVFIAPDGPLPLTAAVSGTGFSIRIADPTQGGALVPLPYGATVVVRYYLPNSFCVTGLVGSPLRESGAVGLGLRVNAATSGPWSLTYETAPHGTRPFRNLDLSPFKAHTGDGFLWLEDGAHPPAPPPAVSGRIESGTARPLFFTATSTGEVVTVRGVALDDTGTEISGAALTMTASGGASVVSTGQPSPDGSVLFRVRIDHDYCVLTLYASGVPIASHALLPSVVDGSAWEPCLFVVPGEDYHIPGSSDITPRRYVRVAVLQPDGFPWTAGEQIGGETNPQVHPSVLLTSARSVFHAPRGGGDASLGSEVLVPYSGPSDYREDSGLVRVGYAPVPGDTLTAAFLCGSNRYVSEPITLP